MITGDKFIGYKYSFIKRTDALTTPRGTEGTPQVIDATRDDCEIHCEDDGKVTVGDNRRVVEKPMRNHKEQTITCQVYEDIRS